MVNERKVRLPEILNRPSSYGFWQPPSAKVGHQSAING